MGAEVINLSSCIFFLKEGMMDTFDARDILNNLGRKLLLLEGEKKKKARDKLIDSMLEEEIPCLAKIIKNIKPGK